MDESIFDNITRWLARGASRRAALPLVGSLLAATGAGLAPTLARKKKKKKATLCREGQTIKAFRKKKAKLLRSGATRGPCPPRSSPPSSPPAPPSLPPAPPSSPPPPATECKPPCPTGSVCNNGACEACDVVCIGSGVDCGIELQAKLDLGGTVRVCPGRYFGTFSFSATSTEVIGAGDGRDPASNTILDADEGGRVLTVPQDVAVTLRGVRITGGYLPSGVGGGIRTAGTLSLASCTVRGNVAAQGGGIYHSGTATGPLELADCQVVGNSTTTGSGGGIYGSSSQPVVLRECAISENRSAEFGGGILSASGPWIIAGSTINANEAAEFGGGIYNSGALTFDAASSITNNSADTAGTGAVGGGIYNTSGAVALNGATVSGNTPDQCAGGVAVLGCPA